MRYILLETLPLLERSCSFRHASACTTLGMMYAAGYGVSQDTKRARSMLQTSCDAKKRDTYIQFVACQVVGHLNKSE